MEKLRKTLKKFPAGYGHKKISVMLDDYTWIDAVTSNMLAVDAAFDEYYNENEDVINGDRFYESREDAQDTLIDEVLSKIHFFAFQDTSTGYIQCVGVGKDEWDVAKEFKGDVGLEESVEEIVNEMEVTEIDYNLYLELVDRTGNDQNAIEMLENYKEA